MKFEFGRLDAKIEASKNATEGEILVKVAKMMTKIEIVNKLQEFVTNDLKKVVSAA